MDAKQRGEKMGILAPLFRMEPTVRRPANKTPPYFWGEDSHTGAQKPIFPIHSGYSEARSIIKDGRLELLEDLSQTSIQYLKRAFDSLKSGEEGPKKNYVKLRLSEDLQTWCQEQHALGRIMPSKGYGLKPCSNKVVEYLGAEKWPKPLILDNSIFGSGMANLLIGAYDPETLYSNYCNDMAFYYEHGFNKVFPEFEALIKTSASDPYASSTPGGAERRAAVEIGVRYIRGKIALEETHKAELADKVVVMDRCTAQILFFYESSLLGMGREAMVRGYDPAAVMSDLIFSSPGTDVVDVGSDLNNSELMNAFLNTADMTETGVVTEMALRRVYDAYAHTSARMLCERWKEPVARMCSTLYSWHIQNDRHHFFRRALLGYPKARKTATQPPREADFDEVFDPDLRTTGFSRPLQKPCNGGDPCDQVADFLGTQGDNDRALLAELWRCLATDPMKYVSAGIVDPQAEDVLSERLRLVMAQAYSLGLIDEMTWVLAHAGHHAWQVNFLFEAAMFGSLLDDGGLRGKLDRTED